MSKFYKYEKEIATKQPESDHDEIFFDGWAVNRNENDYYITYISSEHGGGEKTFNISKKDYDEAKAGNKGLLELIKKYQRIREKEGHTL